MIRSSENIAARVSFFNVVFLAGSEIRAKGGPAQSLFALSRVIKQLESNGKEPITLKAR